MELLAPAGGIEQLRAAVRFGADAVYLASDRFGMRARAANFALEDIPAAVEIAHAAGVKVHVTANILMEQGDLAALPDYFRALDAAGVDAFIIGDLGAAAIARRVAPRVALHVSTQASVANSEAARVWYSLGASRVVCAREMSLDDISRMREDMPADMEIEAFAHGAMCMAVSGRCLISSYLTGRSGNRGHCTQPCRWSYTLEEEKRPGEHFPIEEDGRGTFIMNAKDMNMLAHIDDLLDSGATSLKIEGRSKSAYYIAAMTNAYKTAVDAYMVQRGFEDEDGTVLKPFHDRVIRPSDPDYGKPETTDLIMEHADGAFAGKPDIATVPVASAGEPDDLSYHARSTRRKSNTAAEILPEGWYHAGVRPAEHVSLPDWLLDEPDKVAHRDYSTGFYYPEHKVQQSTDRSAYFRAWLVVGEVLSWSEEDGGRVTIMSRNKIEAGQEVEFVLPGAAPLAYTVPAGGFRDADGHWVESINNPAHVFSMPCPQEVPVNAAIRSRTKKPTLKAE